VNLSFARLGPISIRLTTVVNAGWFDQTNTYALLYDAAGSGVFEQRGGPATTTTGSFSQNRSLVGMNTAPAALLPSESYTFSIDDGGITNHDTLVVNSPQDGWLIRTNDPATSGLQAVNLNYQRLSPVCAILEAIIPADPNAGFPEARINRYLMVFSSAQAGIHERTDFYMTRRSGMFQRDGSLVSQNITEPQINAGESYAFTSISGGITNEQTLAVSSSQSAWLVQLGGAPGNHAIQEVNLSYERLGPISSQLTTIAPGDGLTTFSQTNEFLLLYNAAHSGVFNRRGGAVSTSGTFQRDLSFASP
jgi:hypothetical protein